MRRRLWWMLVVSIGAQSLPGIAAEPLIPQCAFPANPVPPVSDNPETMSVEAANSELWEDGRASFTGDVSVQRGNYRLTAEQVTLSKDRSHLEAAGGILLDSAQLSVESDKLSADRASGSATMTNSKYHFYGRQGHGQAETLTLHQNRNVELEQGSFTTCPPGNHSWLLEADQIRIDDASQTGELEDGWFYAYDTPVLYLPYFTFPTGDRRKSGLLYPTITTSSKRGFDYRQPVYWNIAPNLDATITPRYMTRRGAQLSTEFRYLTEVHSGRAVVDYMATDKEMAGNDSRYLLHYDHAASWNEHLHGSLNYSKVSDDNYLNDIGSSVASSTSNRLERNGYLGYLDNDWQLSGQLADYQVFGSATVPHRQLPRIDFRYAPEQRWFGLAPDLNSQFVYFDGYANDQGNASRLHVEPGLRLPVIAPAGHLELEARVYQTFYSQTSDDPELASSVSRTLPFFRADGQLNFDREGSYNGRPYTQTLEPRLQYIYVPYTNQDDIGLYDTNTLPLSYDGLFRTRRFTGWDRISNANQMTAGVTSRLLDHGSKERANISVGQIFYFDPLKVGLDPADSVSKRNQSDIATDLNLWVRDSWFFQNRLQFDSWRGGLLYNSFIADYHSEDRKGVQFSYRNLPQITPTEAVEQAGITLSWPLTSEWTSVASYQYDVERSRSIESFVALEYENCCYAVQFGYQRNISTVFADDSATLDSATFDGGLFFRIALRGIGNRPRYDDLLRGTLFGRYDPYTLNN